MKINRKNALKLWDDMFGGRLYAADFHGYLMCREGYGDPDYHVYCNGERVYCGWNVHHVLPKAHGGTNVKENLICTNIETNEQAADRITFWIDDRLYQVKKCNQGHIIVCLN